MADDVIHRPTREKLKEWFPGRDKLYSFLERYSLDTVFFYDDFLGDALDGKWANNSGTGGSGAIMTAIDNGVYRLTSGATNGNNFGIALPYGNTAADTGSYRGDLNAVMMARVKIDTLALSKIEVGFTDAFDDAGAVNVLATPTFTAGDAAVWCRDTNANANWQGCGVAAGTAATKVTDAGIPALVAATYMTMGVALKDGQARFFTLDANGLGNYDSGWKASMVTSTVRLTPWVFVQARSASTRLLDIDFVAAWQRRTT